MNTVIPNCKRTVFYLCIMLMVVRFKNSIRLIYTQKRSIKSVTIDTKNNDLINCINGTKVNLIEL